MSTASLSSIDIQYYQIKREQSPHNGIDNYNQSLDLQRPICPSIDGRLVLLA